MNKGVIDYVRETETIDGDSVIVGIFVINLIFIVVITKTASKDRVHTTLDVFHIGTGLQQVIIKDVSWCDAGCVGFRAHDATTEVVTTEHIIANPWETAVITDVHLGMA